MSAARSFLYSLLNVVVHRNDVALPVDPTTWRSILILRYDAIGDMVVTTALLDELHRIAPQARIDILTSTRNDMIVRDDRRIHEHVVFDRKLASLPGVRKKLGRSSYDVVFSLVFNKTTIAGIAARYLGGRGCMTIGPLHPERKELYATWFDVQVPLERNVEPMATMLVRMLEYVQSTQSSRTFAPRLELTSANLQFADRERSRSATGKAIALNLAAGNAYRTWSEAHNQELLQQLIAEFPDVHVFLCTDTSRADVASKLHGLWPKETTVVTQTDDVRDVAAFMHKVNLVITPDTSIVHFADAANTPVVVLYSLLASFLKEWGPVQSPHVLLHTPTRSGIDTIEPDRVMSAVKQLWYDTINS